jgi:hypothetical protein
MTRVLLALVPIAMLTIAIPFVNHVEPRLFGLPFLLVWILAWIVLTPGVMLLIRRMDAAR